MVLDQDRHVCQQNSIEHKEMHALRSSDCQETKAKRSFILIQ